MNKLGKPYFVESGVVATLRKMARSTGRSDQKLMCVNIVEGTQHTLPLGMTESSRLSQETRDRYRVPVGCLVSVRIKPASWWRVWPDQRWT